VPEPTDTDELSSESASTGTDVRTVLIADIRGYTTFTGERGDEAAAALAARFAEITAAVVAARGGQLVELRGDEALVVFASTRQALRSALELQAQFAAAELPRGVGIGMDAGEAVRVGDGYRGSALNLAARLCALAGPGEVIASDAVVHLASTVEGIRYASPRAVRVKGFPEPVRAVRVIAVTAATPPPRRRRAVRVDRRRLALLAAALVGAVGTGVTLFALGMDQSDSPQPTASAPAGSPIAEAAPFDGPGLAFIDPETGEPIGERLALGSAVEVEYVEGAFWALAFGPPALHRIEPESHAVTGTIPIAFSPGTWLVDGSTIWFSDYEAPLIHKIDAISGRQITEFRVSDDPVGLQGIALGAGSLWVTVRNEADGLLRIDPVTGDVQHRYPIFASSVVASDDAVWAGGFDTGEIHRIDPDTDEVTIDVPVSAPISNLALSSGFVWATNPENGEVFKVDDSGRIVDTYSVPGAWYLGVASGRIWAAGEEERTVDAIDVLTGEQTTFDMPRSINDLAEGDGELALAMPIQMADVLADVSGNVLRVGTSFNPFEYTDPAIAGSFGNPLRDAVEQATCAKLLNYPDLPAPDGQQLQPEVAAAMPDVSADGLSYSFTIREGYAFSPPSSEPITAETYRYSIERAMSPGLGPNATAIEQLSIIAGAQAFHDGEANSVSGLQAEGSTLTITLERPDPAFLHRLALPIACPVPTDTAAIMNGVDYPIVPRSGPYYMADYLGGVVMVLKSNPNYPGPRTANFDAIVWRVLEEPGRLIGEVERGETDLVIWAEGLEPGGPVDQEWGAGSDAAAGGDQRYFLPPLQTIDAVALNRNDPLLADATVRQAIALAIDRATLAEIFAGVPTTSLLSPAVPGSDFTQGADAEPNIDRALELLGGRTGTVTVGACEFPGCEEWANALAQQLDQIGIYVEIRLVEDPIAEASAPDSDIGIVNVFGDCGCMIPDAATALGGLLKNVPAGWMPDDLARELDLLASLTEPERTERTVEAIDRLTGEPLLIPFATYGPANYFSERIGCQVASGSSPGLNLVALCLKEQ
jgi:ABC-type transport system substrate-binding protein/class 3 adenylate cyclase